MKILSNIKILYKFIGGFLIVIFIVGSAGIYSAIANQEIHQRIIKHAQLVGLSQQLIEHTQLTLYLMQSYLLVENTVEIETLKTKIPNSMFETYKVIKDLQSHRTDPYLLGLIEKFLQIANDASSELAYSHDLRLGLEASESKDDKVAQSKIASLKETERESLDIIQDSQAKTTEAMGSIVASSQKTFNETQLYAKTVQRITIVVLSAGFILSLIVSLVITRIILKPIGDLQNIAQKVAQGDLTQRVDIKSNDEIGYLAKVFNQMLDNLSQSAKKLEQSNITLQEKLAELQKFKELTVGRELKMVELKEILRQAQDEIKKLKGGK